MQSLVVVAHPCRDGFSHAAAASAVRGLERAGHAVDLIDLHDDGFRAVMSREEREAYHSDDPILDDQVADHAARLRRAEIVVFVYPTWWSGQPAMLKGWVDRVWIAGVAWREGRRGRPRPMLTNIRRIVVVTTHGSTKLVNAFEGESGKRTITRSLRPMCSRLARTTWCALYGIDTSDEAKRVDFLDRVERTVAKL